MKLSKHDTKILKLFSKWSNSFQVLENGQFQFGRREKWRNKHLMIASGYLEGPLPEAGHYSTASLSSAKLIKYDEPKFPNKLDTSPLIDLKAVTEFEISKQEFSNFS